MSSPSPVDACLGAYLDRDFEGCARQGTALLSRPGTPFVVWQVLLLSLQRLGRPGG